MNCLRTTLTLRRLTATLSILLTAAMHSNASAQSSLGTAITYSRINLKIDGQLLDGTFDVRFKLFTEAEAGTLVGEVITKTGVSINDGVLRPTTLNFGPGVFTGEALFLEVKARQGNQSFQLVGPRERLRAVPFALSLPGLFTQQNSTCPNIIGGFAGNFVADGVVGATIGGGGKTGQENSVTGEFGTVGGGEGNTVSGFRSTVAGGINNTCTAQAGFIGGGFANLANGNQGTIAGGFSNTASGLRSTVAGGAGNIASGDHSTVAGGLLNLAQGTFSFAAGNRAKADAIGSFVWGDSTNADIFSGGTNTFNVRASGGTAFYSNSAATAGVLLAPGGGSWAAFSDRAGKSNIQPVNPRIALQKVVQLPISTWNYNAQDKSIRHMGPMAQDFHAAFGVGEDDKHITTIDADGVALAAIQGLHQSLMDEVSRLRETATAQAAELAQLKAHLAEIRTSSSTKE